MGWIFWIFIFFFFFFSALRYNPNLQRCKGVLTVYGDVSMSVYLSIYGEHVSFTFFFFVCRVESLGVYHTPNHKNLHVKSDMSH